MKKLKKDKPKITNAFHLYARLFHYVKPFWLALILAAIGSMVYSGVDAWFVYFIKPLMDDGLNGKNTSFMFYAPFLVMAVFVVRGLASFTSSYFIARVSRRVIMQIRQDMFSHIQRLPARYFDHTTSGHLLSMLLYTVEQISNASADVLTSAVQSLFLSVGLIIVMFSISWRMTLLYFVIVPLVTVIMRIASLRIRRLSLSIQDSVSAMTHRAEEAIEGYKVIRTFEGQTLEVEKFNRAVKVNQQREMKVVVARSLSAMGVQWLMAIALAVTLYIAAIDVSHSVLSAGGFVAMIGAMLAMLKPMKDLALVQNKLYRGLAGAQSIFALLDEPAEEDNGTLTITRAKGLIEFSHVHFAYDVDHPVLNDISLTIQPGQVVALVGRSGSGKTTLAHLLPLFYANYSGEIKLDHHSLRDYHLSDLRKQFAFVSQQVTLFHDTIYNNIAYGRANIPKEAVYEAARAAHALEFIEKMPNGMDTIVGENGVLLSGGQRQRIAIARAILKNAPIFILDEATSALDTESERHIQAALDQFMQTRTTIVIAHRLSTVEHADVIVVMDQGRIIEQGSHETLLALNGAYARLYRMQFQESVTSDESEGA